MIAKTVLISLAGIALWGQTAQPSPKPSAPQVQGEIPKDKAPQVGSSEPSIKTDLVPHRTFEVKDIKVVTPIPGKPVRWVKVPTSTTRIDERKPYMRVYYWPPDGGGEGSPRTAAEDGETPRTADGRPYSHGMNTDPVNFSFNSAEVLPPATHLAQVANWVRSSPDNAVTLTGHADPRGGKAFNQRLSQRRAEAVRARLLELGVPSDRVSVRALGTTQQKKGRRTEDSYWLSRRVEITLRAASEPRPKS